jgi:hypothetical protein
MSNPNFDQLVTTTLEHRMKKLADNHSNSNVLMYKIGKSRNIKVKGGRDIQTRIAYSTASNFQRISGMDTFDVTQFETQTMAVSQWKQFVGTQSISKAEIMKNDGDKEQTANIVGSLVDGLLNDLMNNINAELYSDGTANGGKQIDGLQSFIQDGGQGTYRGINAATYPYWRNIVQNVASPLGGGGAVSFTTTTAQGLMGQLFNRLDFNSANSKPNLIMSGIDAYTIYHDSLNDKTRYEDVETANSGFSNIKFMSAPVCFENDGFQAVTGIPANRMYFLNTNDIQWITHPKSGFKSVDQSANKSSIETREPTNQLGYIYILDGFANLICNNRRHQGVLITA